jgi:hypothetical protein
MLPKVARKAAEVLKLVPESQGVESEAALAFAMASDTARAESLAQDLGNASHSTPRCSHADAARVRALSAYKDFLTLWKDADPDIPS